MTDAYRNEKESLQARNRELEEELAAQRSRVEDLERHAAREEELVARLRTVLDGHTRASRRRPLLVSAVLGVAALAGAWAMTRAQPPPPSPPPPSPPPPPRPAAMGTGVGVRPPGGLGGLGFLEAPGVRFEIEGQTFFVSVDGTDDMAGYKYRASGHRSAWFTLDGGLPVGPRFDCSQREPHDVDTVQIHGVGDFLSVEQGNVPAAFTSLTIRMGDNGGRHLAYRLAPDGRGTMTAHIEGGYMIGSFQADVSLVEDTSRLAPRDARVVRVRGTYRLPVTSVDPSDTAP